jgi:hypothetical protein
VATVTADGHIHLIPVTVGRDMGATVQITSGLSTDIKIVRDPADSSPRASRSRSGATMAKRLRPAGLAGATSLGGCSQVPAYHTPAPIPRLPRGRALEHGDALHHGAGRALVGRVRRSGSQRTGKPDREDSPTLAAALARRDRGFGLAAPGPGGPVPSVTLGSNLTYDRQSQDRPLRNTNGQENIYGANTLSGTASYEVDLWGRVRAGCGGPRQLRWPAMMTSPPSA